MERSGPWWQFSVWVQTVFRAGESRVRRGQQALWVPDRDLGCGCPALQVGRTFLLIGGEDGRSVGPEDSRLVADRASLALPWREHWSPKLRGFRGQDRRGRCPADPQRNSTRSPSHWQPQTEFTPPHLEPPHSETLPPRPQPLPPAETGLPPHTRSLHHSLKPRPKEEGGSPPHQHTHHTHHTPRTHPPLREEESPQRPVHGQPSPDTPLRPPTQPSHRRPKPAHARKHSPTVPTPTQPLQPTH